MSRPLPEVNPTTTEEFVALALENISSALPVQLKRAEIYALLAIATRDAEQPGCCCT